ncbi:MAG: hypothetical protein NTY74_16400 [Ignavibacteriae bacterium]|nr:hypothetical protein [Ignavibacteriota bacterium]
MKKHKSNEISDTSKNKKERVSSNNLKKRNGRDTRKVTEMNNQKKSKKLMYYQPNINSNDPEERELAIWLNETRKAKAGLYSNEKWYPSLDKYAKELGLPDIFDKKFISKL